MTNFNPSFYESNRKYTKKDAETILTSLGYNNVSFIGLSYANGSSFYFEGENGEQIRVSDHKLTGKRSFNTTQISLNKTKTFIARPKLGVKFVLTPEMIAAAKKRASI